MKLLYTLAFTFIASALLSGQQRIYLDDKWKETDKVSAKYYRIVVKKDSLYDIKDYYINDVLQYEGHSKTPNEPFFQEGIAKWYNSDGNVITQANLLHNKRNGDYAEYYSNGLPKATGTFSNGKANGTYIEYYPTGQIGNKADFVMGKVNGQHIKYDFNGDLTFKLNYVNGSLEGPYEYYEHGQLMAKGTMLHDVQEGECFIYHDNGKVRTKYNVSNSYINGLYFEYDDKGKVTAEGEFKDGKPLRFKSKREGTINGSYYSNEMTLKDNIEAWKLLRDGSIIMESFYKYGVNCGVWKIYSANGKKVLMTKDYTNANCDSEDFLQKVSKEFNPYVSFSDRFKIYQSDTPSQVRDIADKCTDPIITNTTQDDEHDLLYGFREKRLGDEIVVGEENVDYVEPATKKEFLIKNNCQQGYKGDDAITVCSRTFGKLTYKVFTSEDAMKLMKLKLAEEPAETEIYFFYHLEGKNYHSHASYYERYMGFALPKGIIEGLQLGAIKNTEIVYVLEHKFFNVSDFMGSSAADALEEFTKKE